MLFLQQQKIYALRALTVEAQLINICLALHTLIHLYKNKIKQGSKKFSNLFYRPLQLLISALISCIKYHVRIASLCCQFSILY